MNKMFFSALAAVVLSLGAVAGTAFASSENAAVAAVVGSPAEGKAEIVFFREKKFTGAAIKCNVIRDGENLAVLKNGTYFILEVAPGAYQFNADKKGKDSINLEVEAGEVVYVAGGITMGMMKGKPNLSPSDEAAFAEALEKLKPVK